MKDKQLQPAMSVRDLTVMYNEHTILKNVSFDIPHGTLVAIVGPNGAGKTTLLKSLVGLLRPVCGSIQFNGLPLASVRKRIAYVPQRLSIDWDFPASVCDVVLMGRYPHLGWFKRPSNYDYDCVLAALDQVGLYEYKDRHIGELSGGQQQRVFLARALVQEPDVYIMDEPFVGVDVPTEKTIISLLKMLRDEGKTIVVVHHDIQTLSHYFDTALVLNVSVVGYGPIEKMLRPEYMGAAYGNKYELHSL